jgi:hypothetical protein
MPITTWYRGIRFAKDFITRYLNLIFKANEKGNLLLTDGTKEIKFSSTPLAIKRASWDARVLPAVLIGKASGNLQYVSFTKDHLKTTNVLDDDGEHVAEYLSVGGDFDISISLSVRATTIEERDNLLDITCIYLAHPDAKDYFLGHYLILPEAPRLTGESDIKETAIDHPIFASDFTLRVKSRWQEYTENTYYRLANVIADLEAELGEVENIGRIELIDE